MSTIKYTDLFNEVLPEVPGVGNALAENAIRNAVITFCKRTKIWRYWPDAQSVTYGENTYDLEPPPGADVAEILLLKFDGTSIEPAIEDNLPADWQTATGTVNSYIQQDTNSVVLCPVPDENVTDGLTMTLALMPRRTSSAFPAWIWNQYFEGIAAGAKSDLMAMQKKPWSNPAEADRYKKIFDSSVAGANADATRSLTRASTRSKSQH